MKKQSKDQSQYHEILYEKKHQIAVNHFLDRINQQLKKNYLGFTINKVFGQYVHTRMHMYHLTTNNGDKITALLSIYNFQPAQLHGFLDYAHEGHMKPLTAQKKLIEMDNWPSCGAFWRSDQCDVSEAQSKINQHISEINQKLQLDEEGYQIVRCWSQIVQGVNYFMHVVSNTGKKASIGMYVPLDDYGEEQQESKGKKSVEDVCSDEQLSFQISFCTKGHVNYD